MSEVITPRMTPLGAMSAVIDGAADVAPIDSYAYCLLQKYRPDLTSQLRVDGTNRADAHPAVGGSQPGLDGPASGLP